jgi:predicted dehydrogenase
MVVRVAYNLRLLGVMRLLRELLDGGEVGRPLFAHIEVGQWLPDWRSGRRVTEGYSASIERGGGVALDLSHEVDYMFMLFGMPAEWRISTANTGILGIAAPEVFDGSYVFADGFSCTTHMDYLERLARRRIRIVGADGVIECDAIGGTLTLTRGEDVRVFDDPALFDTQGSYLAELEEFFALAGGASGAGHLPTLAEAERVLTLLVDRKAS